MQENWIGRSQGLRFRFAYASGAPEGADEIELRNCTCDSTIAVFVADVGVDHVAERAAFEVRRGEVIAKLTARMQSATELVRRYVGEGVKNDPRVAPVVRQLHDYQLQIRRWIEMPYGNTDVVLLACLQEGVAA